MLKTEKATVSFTNQLLSLFRENGHPELPKTHEILWSTSKNKVVTRVVYPGEYVHFGIENALTQFESDSFMNGLSEIKLDIGIDGLPLAKDRLCLWPILASFVNKKDVSPFIVGAYCGKGGPDNVDAFLLDFLNFQQLDELIRGTLITKTCHFPISSLGEKNSVEELLKSQNQKWLW